MSMNRCVRVSSSVLLVPRRAATNACTLTSGWSANALNSSSVLANAHACLPVFSLIFMGGSTPNDLSSSPNLSLDMSSALSTPLLSSNSSLRALVSTKCCSSISRSNSSRGSMNMRRVRSMIFNSCLGNLRAILLNSAYVNSTSLMQ